MISDASSGSRTSFDDLDAYIALPRIEGLRLAPDGSRIVVGVALPNAENARYTKALWEVDPAGRRPARRLTRSAEGESAVAFGPAGDLLFMSARPRPDSDEDSAASALWSLPVNGGEARVIASPAGGVREVVVSESGTVVFGSGMMPSATDFASDKDLRSARRRAGVSALLHEENPIRYWDHDLGPDRTRLLKTSLTDESVDLTDFTGHVGRALWESSSWDITPDGSTVIATWAVAESGGAQRQTLVAIDVATGVRRTLADNVAHHYRTPKVSPDGRYVAFEIDERCSPADPGDQWLAVIPVAGGELRHVARSWDRWPHIACWTPDGAALVVVAADHGRAPVWRVDVTSGEATRLTSDDAAYSDVQISPNGQIYALRSAVDSPPAPVRISVSGVEPLRGPAEVLNAQYELPGHLDEISVTAEDGTLVRAWLALPHGASADTPAPLVLMVHGGPVMSVNAWSWRANPWVYVAKGYAVLMPDFALSIGYGLDFVRRGWGQWGGKPYTDLMEMTSAAQQRPDIDSSRAAAIGGSFGGYMANWIAGHTDRFSAIASHASVWHLDTAADMEYEFRREATPEALDANSPHNFVDAITTPMLLLHGDRDYRVPIGEAMRLWWDLMARLRAEDGSGPHKFLYFPDENHWILAPTNSKIWYSTVLAFFDHHVLGEDWRRPELLG
ncbi:S9 family peptidase [Allokutzneria sp. NRRL B-24872]|uniref:S9 family peptidase n=1 Tax=Allokutzneria sp. NRRL B-24872 TaxID=1137961 RepID=UPI001FEEBA75|nr:S9 family peptidase [Allokutzneria sp. NRRL B-24872]